MSQKIAGFFRTRNEGETAREALVADGIPREEVNFIAGDAAPHEVPAVGTLENIGAESEAARDAWIGGAVGMAAGMVALAIPGFGPLLLAGPVAAAIGGMTVGAAAGGLVGLMKDYGVSEEEAEFYAEGVRRGGALITVETASDDQAKRAREILDRHGAIDVEKLEEEQRPA